MSETLNPTQQGIYTGYADLLAFFERKRKECPRGISLKQDKGKYLSLQFIFPDTQKRGSKPCGVNFTEDGIIQAVSKAHKVRQALDTIKTSSEFWEWYDRTILEKNEITNNLKTYREIFEVIEQRYWNGRNKNTKRKRSKDIPNDVATYNRYYGLVFNRFLDLDTYPNWTEIKEALYSWTEGSNQFENAYLVIKNICNNAGNSEALLNQLSEIDSRQTEFKEKQSISLDTFLKWHKSASETLPINPLHLNTKKSWLWVASMCAVYGLRASEAGAILNLTKSYTQDGVTIPALNDPTNKELLLVLGDKTYFGVTIKTGGRVCMPMTKNSKILEQLKIKSPQLPIYMPESSKAETIVRGFTKRLRERLISYKCPVTQIHAFRHLANQLGEREGIPQEVRARMLGHSVSINEYCYKQRTNFETTIDILTNHNKEPLSLEAAKNALENNGFDLEDKSVLAILRIIYQF